MENEEVIEFLENRLVEIKAEEPGAFNTIGSYETVINDLLNEN